jgi:hypothetical protein
MRHDELLKKINSANGYKPSSLIKIIHQITKLHKPIYHEQGLWCSGCSATELYPCPTVQAISKEF